jgi:hypothetical protein
LLHMGVQIDQALTEKMVEKAIAACASIHYAGDKLRMRHAILQGHCEHCKCLTDDLVEQIGDYLGQVDKTVKAIYQYGPIYPIQDGRDEDIRSLKRDTGINLIMWVERKSAALGAFIASLETFLASSLRELGCVNATSSCFTLDVEIVDDQDVIERRGFGLVLKQTIFQSKLVWSRTSPVIQESLPEMPAAERVEYTLPDNFDPELMPESRLIDHALSIERIPENDRRDLVHHLLELKVTLIRRMISDQLAYIDIAKNWFSVEDLAKIYQRRIGYGKIGGKSAGMLLAERILEQVADEEIRSCVRVPESYFLGSDMIYIFMVMNGLMYWNDQKYKPSEQIWAEYPQIQEEFQAGSFPPEIRVELHDLLEKLDHKPLIVRSSSQLEDNFGTSFAGKYESFFCPNQGTPDENLNALTRAIARTYASTMRPEALLYRRSKGLQDYDERMAVLIQAVQGDQFGEYFLPQGSGVAFSRNLYRWSPQIRREDGFVRLVWGLGTRAVQRTGDDFPRMVALSHPLLLPDDSSEAIRHYSQKYVDLINVEKNEFETLPVHEVLAPNYTSLNLITQLEQDGSFVSPRMRVSMNDVPRLAITYHEFLRRTQFAPIVSRALNLLEQHFHTPVDVEFTVQLLDPQALKPPLEISLLQCRPQSFIQETQPIRLPENLPEQDVLFSTRFMVPRGFLSDIRYIVYVVPEIYFSLPSETHRHKVGQIIAKLNAALGEKSYLCIGPGRWGSTNLDLGVYVSYADVHHAAALVELSGKEIGTAPEPSLGTHFFQDLMEAQIYPLAVFLDDEQTRFNKNFFLQSTNCIDRYLDVKKGRVDCVRLIEVGEARKGMHVEVSMDDEVGEAVAYFAGENPKGFKNP